MDADLAYRSLLTALGALGQLVVIALLLERALAFVFEYHWFRQLSARVNGLKAPIAIALSMTVCFMYRFDVLAELFRPAGGSGAATQVGIVLTAAIVAGGSAGAMSLFQATFNWSKDARDGLIRARQSTAAAIASDAAAQKAAGEARFAEAETRRLKAVADLASAQAEATMDTAALTGEDRRSSSSGSSSEYDRRRTVS